MRMKTLATMALTAVALAAAGCSAPEGRAPEPSASPLLSPSERSFEAVSLFGTELERIELPAEFAREQRELLERALDRLAREPDEIDAHIWVGRRLAYLGRYRDAVRVYTEALERFPESSRLLRHRGHRNITLRRLGAAVDDLTRAAAIARAEPDFFEEDGLPNQWDIPRSTHRFNVFYHLGLAHYLRGEYERALAAWEEGLDAAVTTDDMLVANLYWMSNAAARLGDRERAIELARRARPDMEILENDAYQKLLMARAQGSSEALLSEASQALPDGPGAERPLDWITIAYGVSVSRELEGGESSAAALREVILESQNWAAFGYIAAEADAARERPTRESQTEEPA
jgi:tetratricopeptide (TPR) repeat protein